MMMKMVQENPSQNTMHITTKNNFFQMKLIRTYKKMKDVFDANDFSKIIVDYKKVIKDWKDWRETRLIQNITEKTKSSLGTRVSSVVKNLLQKTNQLLTTWKEFEMRQSAQRSVHAFTGKTGKLDMNRLAKYQIVEDVFKEQHIFF